MAAKERKSDAVRRLVREGDYRKALRIAKGFKLGISKEDQEAMKLGYECMVWPRYYQSISVDTRKAAQKAVDVLVRIYGCEKAT